MRFLLDGSPLLKVVGEAANLGEAESQIRSEWADSAVMEIQMPIADGLAAITALRDQFPDLRIAVCSFHDDAATKKAARTNGADAYLTKPLTTLDLGALFVDPDRSLLGAGR